MTLNKKAIALGTAAVVSLGVLGANVAPAVAAGGGTGIERFHAAQTSLQEAIQIAESEAGGKAIGASFQPQVGRNGIFVVGVMDDQGNVTMHGVDANDGSVQLIAANAGEGPEGDDDDHGLPESAPEGDDID